MFLTTAVETRMCHLLHSDFDTRHQNNSSPCWLTLARRPLSPCRACYRRLAFLSPSPSTAIVPTLLLLSFSLHTHIYTCSFCSHSLVFRLPLNSVPLSSTVLPFSLACVLLILGHTPTVSWLRRSSYSLSFSLRSLSVPPTRKDGFCQTSCLVVATVSSREQRLFQVSVTYFGGVQDFCPILFEERSLARPEDC